MSMPRRVVVVLALIMVGFGTAADASPPANFTNELVTSAVNQPIALTFLPDGRMLIVEKTGRILICNPQVLPLTTATYMTITNIDTGGERGLLNLVLDPGFGVSNNYFYVYYHPASPGVGRIARFTHVENSGGLTSRGNLASQVVLWQDTDGYIACCHYGGGLDFGPDGTLFLTIGEKFDGTMAQNLSKAGGKIIRINSDGTIPPDNYGMSDGAGGSIYDPIFAYGLRNPFRARWDLPTGRLFIGEVGGNDQNKSSEDVHVATLASSGVNFGWPLCEGSCDNPDFPSCNCALHDDPIFSYPHNGSGASITGGVVYRGGQFPSSPYYGAYFYGDYVRGFIRYLTFNAGGTAVTGDYNFDSAAGEVISITEGPDGALYFTTYNNQVRRYVYDSGNQGPTITAADAAPSSGPAPLEVTFTGTATDPEGDAMTFKWVFGDGDSATGNVTGGVIPTTMHTYTSNGAYTATLLVSDPTNPPATTERIILVGSPPEVTIDAPPNLMTFQAGDTIFYSGSAYDPDETLDGSHYSWTVRFKHNEHFHPGPVGGVSGTNGFFVIDSTGHDWYDNTAYLIDLQVTDSDGLVGADTVTILPQKVNLSFDTSPSGISIAIDGVPHVTPFVYDTMIGFQHTVSVSPTACVAGTGYAYVSWSDGGAATHTLTVPDVDSSYVVTYSVTGDCGVPVESGLVMHLRGDDGVTESSGSVTSWADLSVSGNDLSVVSGAPALVAGGLNGHAVVDFDGVTDGMGRTGFSGLPTGSADRTMVMVVRYESDGWGGFTYGTASCNQTFGLSVALNTGNLMVQGWCTANDFISGTAGNGAGWMTHGVVLEGGAFTHYKDGAVINTGSHTFATGSTRIRLGVELDDDPKVKMQVAEILVYDRALSSFELQQVEDYLQAEYFAPPVPTVAITTPADGQSIPGDSILVGWASAGDTTLAEHVHVQLDNDPRVSIMQLTGTHVFNGVAIGPHTVRVELASASHAVLSADSVSVTVTGPPPVALADTAAVTQGDTVTVDVLANDSDPDGTVDSTTVAVVTPPQHGVVDSVDAVTGVVRYIHDGSFAAVDSFTYTVKDDLGNTSNEATVVVNVTLTSDPPAVEGVVLAGGAAAVSPDDSLVVTYDVLPPATAAATAWYRNGAPFAALYLPMEGSTSLSLQDFSGVGLGAATLGAPSWSGTGGFDGGGAWVLGGADALVVPDDPALDVDQVSIAAWIRVGSFLDDARIVSKEFGTAQPYSIYTLNLGTPGVFTAGEDKVEFRVGLEGQNRLRLTGVQQVPLDTWTHVAATFDGTTMRVYVNGQLDGSLAASGVLRKNDEPVYIGASEFYGTPSTSQYFDGAIDDVRIYGRALSGEQIDALYALGRDVVVPQETAYGETWRADVTPFGLSAAGVTVASNTVLVGNVPPTAGDDTTTVTKGDSVQVDVLANDTDPDGSVDSTSVSIVTPPTHGSASVDAVTGVIEYTHDGTATAADSLTYTVQDDSGAVSNVATVRITVDIVSAVGDTPGMPTRFALHQNVPNPFNPTTAIAFDVPTGGARVTLEIYDVGGHLVDRLVDGFQSGGHKRVTWTGTDRRGHGVASGVYFYRLRAKGFVETRKMILIQ